MDISLQQLWQMEMDQLALERETTDPDPVIWRWSPLDIKEFDVMLHIAVEHFLVSKTRPRHDNGKLREVSFAEAGSGIGTKLYLAKYKYGLDEFGYEINDEYLAKSQELGVYAQKWDLAEVQPTWAAYDIVYVARPFKDDIKERRWEEAVCTAMRPGGVYMAAFAAYKPYHWPCIYRRSFRGIWIKPGPDDEPPRTLAKVQQFVTAP